MHCHWMWKDSSILCFTECEGKIRKARGIWVNAEGHGIRAIERVVKEGFIAVASDIEMRGSRVSNFFKERGIFPPLTSSGRFAV